MNKVWNNETSEWDFLPDEEPAKQPQVAPRKAAVTSETIKAITTPASKIEQPERKVSGQVEANKRWRAKSPTHKEKHRAYMLDYMKRYRAKP